MDLTTTRFEKVRRFKRPPMTAALTLVVFSFCLIVPGLQAWPHAREASAVISAGKVKATVQELGLGAKVKLSTVSRATLCHGYITSIGENSFEVTDVAKWQANNFDYSTITRIAGRRLPDSTHPVENRLLRGVFSAASRLGVGP